MRQRARDNGQATVELALALPVVVVLVLGIIQVVVIARDQLAVELAAREAARAAAVSASPSSAAVDAAHGAITLRPLQVETRVVGDRVTVTVSFVDPTEVPMVGSAMPGVTVRASVTMQREPP